MKPARPKTGSLNFKKQHIYTSLIVLLLIILIIQQQSKNWNHNKSLRTPASTPVYTTSEHDERVELDYGSIDEEYKVIGRSSKNIESKIKRVELASNSHEFTADNSLQMPERMNATFVSLVRNSELSDIIPSIMGMEDRFNHKFHYDWVFLNDVPFTERFIAITSKLVSGRARYGVLPKEHWSIPSHIDKAKAAEKRQALSNDGVMYADMVSYRHMCRFESGFFFNHPLMQEYQWYWRVEPSTRSFCNIPYDPFKFMIENNKTYGFTITLHEYEKTIPTLWDATKRFLKNYPSAQNKDSLLKFISDDNGDSYNLCHFWSNFEIANMDFWRSDKYKKYFEHLDKEGGFFYERWGDAPIHTIAAALFLPKSEIYYFEDIGYYHNPFYNCPIRSEIWLDRGCSCLPESSFTFHHDSCTGDYYTAAGLEKPGTYERYY